MRNLLIVLALVFTILTSCKKDDSFTPDNQQQEEVQDPVVNDDPDNDDNDDDDNQDGEDPGDDDDNQEEEEDDNGNNQNFCFVEETTLAGNGFEHTTIFERTALGRLETILFVKNGAVDKKAEINYRTNGNIRAMAITQNGRQSAVTFDTKGRPVDRNTTYSDGSKTITKYGLDDKDRIIKEIVRREGKTTSERNHFYEGNNLVASEGFSTTSSGIEISFERAYKYDENGLNPLAVDAYLAHIVLGKFASENLIVQMETGTGVQFEASYILDASGFPIKGSYKTPADGEMGESFDMDCL